jgi:peptidoglycan L-alanyl-D-glutamate endopeptidase CwlK
MDANSEARLLEVMPALADRIRQLAQMLATENILIRVTQGVRTWPQQQALYNQGRDAEGNVIDKSKVVTDAKPGYSYHCFGLAVDVVPFDGSIPDWNISHPAWKRIVAVGESVGLYSGTEFRTFPDWPHFQLTGFLPVSPDEDVRNTFINSGVEAVWASTGLND